MAPQRACFPVSTGGASRGGGSTVRARPSREKPWRAGPPLSAVTAGPESVALLFVGPALPGGNEGRAQSKSEGFGSELGSVAIDGADPTRTRAQRVAPSARAARNSPPAGLRFRGLGADLMRSTS